MMSSWIAAVSVAGLVATVPLTWVFRVLRDLPEPVALSHRPWPVWANLGLIALVTAAVTVFIRDAYYVARPEPALVAMRFLITALFYVFGFVLLTRQVVGLYPEYFVTTGRTGLLLRKALYRNIVDVETLGESRGETRLRIEVRTGVNLPLILPSHQLPTFYAAIKENQPDL